MAIARSALVPIETALGHLAMAIGANAQLGLMAIDPGRLEMVSVSSLLATVTRSRG
jgi:hypothetical protein